MADEKLQQDELQAEKDFDAGFTDQPSEAPAAKAAEPETPAEQATETPAEPVEEFVQIKKGDFEKLMAAAEKTASLEQQMSKAFGSIGNLKQMVEAQPKAAPVVGKVELSDEDFAELKADFPELAENTKKAMQRALSKIGVSAADASAGLSKADVERMMVELQTEKSVDFLDDAHPGWRDIVGRPDDSECEFRNWLKTKSSTYQKRINTTNDGFEIASAIDAFTEAKQAKAKVQTAQRPTVQDPKQDERRRVIAGAVLPKGDGGPAAPRKSAEDWFNEGFQSR